MHLQNRHKWEWFDAVCRGKTISLSWNTYAQVSLLINNHAYLEANRSSRFAYKSSTLWTILSAILFGAVNLAWFVFCAIPLYIIFPIIFRARQLLFALFWLGKKHHRIAHFKLNYVALWSEIFFLHICFFFCLKKKGGTCQMRLSCPPLLFCVLIILQSPFCHSRCKHQRAIAWCSWHLFYVHQCCKCRFACDFYRCWLKKYGLFHHDVLPYRQDRNFL